MARVKHDCPSGKITYKRRTHAESDASRIVKNNILGKHQLRPYRCGMCGYFHLTSKPRRRQQAAHASV